MRNAAMVLVLAMVGAMALGSGPNDAACSGCRLDPWCEPGPGTTMCEIYEHDGQRWLQHEMECDNVRPRTPLKVLPTAAYLAPGGAHLTEQKPRCKNPVAGHTTGRDSNATSAVPLRI